MRGSVERRSDATTKTNPGSKPIKTTTDLFGNILCLELNLLSSQYLKTNIHQSLLPTLGRLPDLHRPSASDFVFFFRPRTPSRSGGFGRLVSGLHRRLSHDLIGKKLTNQKSSDPRLHNNNNDGNVLSSSFSSSFGRCRCVQDVPCRGDSDGSPS